MKKILSLVLLSPLLICCGDMSKHVSIDSRLIELSSEERIFSYNLFTFCYANVDKQGDNFCLKPNGYLKSVNGYPYTHMIISISSLDVLGVNVVDYKEVGTKIEEYEEVEKGFEYILKDYKDVMILNSGTSDVILSPLYFYSYSI